MQNSVVEDLPRRRPGRHGFNETELEKRGIQRSFGAPVTGAVSVSDGIAVCFGDGNVRFFLPQYAYTTVKAHLGVVLCVAAHEDHIITGGDDGRFLQISFDGKVKEIANFNSKWVDCVAAKDGTSVCSSGSSVYIWSNDHVEPTILKHSSTVGGLAFDKKGKRLAVAHYGGTTIWEKGDRRWKSKKLIWKGFHGAVTFSPDGKYVVTAMQENALHGWRIRDKADLAMTGYPAKVKSFSWVGDTPHLVTSGADEAICWPFDGKDGPMGRPPVCVANGGKQISTYVHALPEEKAVIAGFRDGAVLLAEIVENKEPIVLKGSSGNEITAIALTSGLSHILIGDSKGNILWTTLWAGETNVKSI